MTGTAIANLDVKLTPRGKGELVVEGSQTIYLAGGKTLLLTKIDKGLLFEKQCYCNNKEGVKQHFQIVFSFHVYNCKSGI